MTNKAFKAALEAACDAYYDDGGGWKDDTDATTMTDGLPFSDYARQEHTKALRAFLAEAERQGWRLVPVEPDTAMLQDGRANHRALASGGVCGMTIDAQVRSACAREAAAWSAMVAAAPRIEDATDE